MKKKLLLLFIVFFSDFFFSQSILVNTAHLDHLYEDVVVKHDTLGIIHIYAEYPDYKWVDDADEGTACVDDAARAMVFYLYNYQFTRNSANLKKVKNILNFLFYMQAENGFFYNFIWKDNTINKTFRTSVAEPNWWSWRALWALAEADKYFKNKDSQLSNKISQHLKKLIKSAKPVLDKKEEYGEFGGLILPLWLPYETAADQGAVILKGLSVYYAAENDSSVLPIIHKVSKGLLKMQAGDQVNPPYYAFLSWQNTWHAWGNSQADAILNAGIILNDTSLINPALKEVRYFYPFLLKENFLSDFSIEKAQDSIKFDKKNIYSQIAYGFRPMIFASISAYQFTGDPFYARLAGRIGAWFMGKNIAGTQMYFPESGVCFDGLSEDKANKNSGAESTIEALLSMIKIEYISLAKEQLMYEVDRKYVYEISI